MGARCWQVEQRVKRWRASGVRVSFRLANLKALNRPCAGTTQPSMRQQKRSGSRRQKRRLLPSRDSSKAEVLLLKRSSVMAIQEHQAQGEQAKGKAAGAAPTAGGSHRFRHFLQGRLTRV